MVHRPSDSRLLTNLLSHEKDYSKHLFSLFDFSHASLASFSAYASASSPPASLAIIAVAGTLAGADDALRRYAASIDEWREHLTSLKDLEDEVGNIMRDREILVTRLIKASKSEKPNRESLLVTPPISSSSVSLKSDLSGSLSHFNSAYFLNLNSSSKLSAAQSELQACETHLAAKEKELDDRRAGAIREGLQIRCKAMVECGWTWGEMGKEGLRALESMGETANGSANQSTHPLNQKPLPDPTRPSSDLSSIGPSQSASQINLQDLNIPPAHAISDYTMPTSTSPPPSSSHHRPMFDRRIAEEDEYNISSDEDQNAGPVQVVENERFAATNRSRKFSIRKPMNGSAVESFPMTTVSDIGHNTTEHPQRERRLSGGFFGSIRGLFRGGTKDKEHEKERHKEFKDGVYAGGSEKKWASRTDKNLKAAKRTQDGRESSSDDDDVPRRPATDLGIGTSVSNTPPIASPKKRLRKNKVRAAATKSKRASDWVHGQPGEEAEKAGEKGWTSDSGAIDLSVWDGDENKTKKGKGKAPEQATDTRTVRAKPKTSTVAANGENNTANTDVVVGASAPGDSASLVRNSSLVSSASAPAAMSGRRERRGARTLSTDRTAPLINTTPKRSASIADESPSMVVKTKSRTRAVEGHERRPSTNGIAAETSVSLMTIVEGVTRQNRDGWKYGSVGPTLEVTKAPPPVSRGALDEMPSIIISPSTSSNMELPKAPGSVIPAGPSSASRTPSKSETLPLPPPLHTSHASAPIPPSGRGNVGQTVHKPTPRPAKSPLRSALRNSSRSPSPAPVPLPLSIVTSEQAHQRGRSQSPPKATEEQAEASTSWLNGIFTKAPEEDADDKSSVSSYETGHEVFDEPEEDTEREQPPPPPPPHDSSHVPKSNGVGSDVSASTTSNEAPTVPARRKSVRVSLQPTFSATPPAIDDDDETESRHAPWASGRAQKEEEVADMWEDSSEEDEEYKRAKRLLSRLARKEKRERQEKKEKRERRR